MCNVPPEQTNGLTFKHYMSDLFSLDNNVSSSVSEDADKAQVIHLLLLMHEAEYICSGLVMHFNILADIETELLRAAVHCLRYRDALRFLV